MYIYQACCFLPSEFAFILAAGFVEGSKHGERSERQEKCVSTKSKFSFSNLKDYLKLKLLKPRSDLGYEGPSRTEL